MYSAADVDRVIQFVGNDFIWFTKCTRQTNNITITEDSSAFDLSAVTGFRAERALRFWIPSENELVNIPHETLLAFQESSEREGVPEKIAFTSATAGELYPTPDANYTGKVMWVPPHTTWTPGTQYAAAATATVSGGAVTSIVVTSPGGPYSAAPTVSFSGGSGSGATATATIDDAGQVTAVTITAAGSGYSSAPTVSFSGVTTADVDLILPDDFCEAIFSTGAVAKLQKHDKDHKYAQPLWNEYLIYRQSMRGAGNFGARSFTRPEVE